MNREGMDEKDLKEALEILKQKKHIILE